MNVGSILGSISPAFGIASGQGLGQYLPMLSPMAMMAGAGKGMHFGHTDHSDVGNAAPPAPGAGPAPAPAPTAPTPAAPAVPGAPGAPSAAAPKSAMQDGQPHGLAMDGKIGMGNVQGILSSLGMMAPKPMAVPTMQSRWG